MALPLTAGKPVLERTVSIPPAAQPPVAPRADTVNILIVDDEPKNLTVLETVLEDPGHRLVRATSGEEALLALMADEFAVLVLDVRMPGMTGFELASMIKQRRKTARVPIIFLTAYYNEDSHMLDAYGSGAVDYLHKPVNAAVLRSKVAVFAELHRKGRAVEEANRALQAEVVERRLAEARLSELAETLDRRVTERTDALQASEAQLRDADRRKDEFLATLAHELRNPLAPVRNAAEILRSKGSANAAELQWACELIDRQMGAMGRLIDDLMDVSRINQGKIDLRRERVDVGTVLRSAVETTQPLIAEFGHAFALRLPERPLLLDADTTRLAQAFMNLLNNAAKYMDKGGRIEVDVEQQGADVVVSVRDQGIGISADRLENVFEMFSQIESALSRSRGGLGIGLALTQRLVELHEGSITAESAGLGQGSRFVVRLPLAEAGAVAPIATAAPRPDKPAAAAAKLRILVADDNQDAAATLAMLLEVMGHQVRHVNDGEAAVQAAADFTPQVVLLDIGMPKLNGYEACKRIRAASGGSDMTLVAITGWGQVEDKRIAHEAGFDEHFVKPLDPAVLTGLFARLPVRA